MQDSNISVIENCLRPQKLLTNYYVAALRVVVVLVLTIQ